MSGLGSSLRREGSHVLDSIGISSVVFGARHDALHEGGVQGGVGDSNRSAVGAHGQVLVVAAPSHQLLVLQQRVLHHTHLFYQFFIDRDLLAKFFFERGNAFLENLLIFLQILLVLDINGVEILFF